MYTSMAALLARHLHNSRALHQIHFLLHLAMQGENISLTQRQIHIHITYVQIFLLLITGTYSQEMENLKRCIFVYFG